ncbi:EVE domain-containing protein [Lujinxingia litoralis]|uniref:EVE domain-containing protein n=1 Tax=Lujinxingia litoralis TaxID=2211119 RepID=A0A328C6J9_9DELT|nr:EVE domain-containing protein [Lujinxingia litoralis]RAL22432.1 EVE domain-containing protein [Lujinxingia litoralis]
MRYWLVKSEPDEFSLDNLKELKKTSWEGVRNYQARNFMRDEMAVGDRVLFYHSRERPPGVVGVAEVASGPYADPSQFDVGSPYFDAKSRADAPRWVAVDLVYVRHLRNRVGLDRIKATEALQEMVLVKRPRLSVMPVSREHFELILEMSREVE